MPGCRGAPSPTGVRGCRVPRARHPAALALRCPSCDAPGRRRTGTPRRACSEIIDLLRSKTAHDFTLYKPGRCNGGSSGAWSWRRSSRRRGSLHRKFCATTRTNSRFSPRICSSTSPASSATRMSSICWHEDHSGSGARPRSRPADPDLDRGVQHRRGDLLPCHAVSRGHRRCEARHQASGLCLRRRSGRDRRRPGRPVSRENPGGCFGRGLARFFSKEEHGYRVSPELRATVVFTVQDVLADPPFSRLNFVSCRNLLIYLGPEAQAKVLAAASFRTGNGRHPAAGHIGNRRRGRRPLRGDFEAGAAVPACRPEPPERVRSDQKPRRRRAVTFEPNLATIAPDRSGGAVPAPGDGNLCAGGGPDQPQLRMSLFAGSDRPLSARRAGHPSHDLLAMARQGMRTKLRSAIQQASKANARVVIAGGRIAVDGQSGTFSIAARPVPSENEDLLLVCFVDDPKTESARDRPGAPGDARLSRTGAGTGGDTD